MTDPIAQAYDAVPYENCVYDFTAPQHLWAIGHLFGHDAPDFRKARVLELGSASGGNLIPMAARWPKARFVGIDISQVQTAHAQALAHDLGLDNVTFLPVSILDMPDDLGQFDYIIAHGFLSWVPDMVQRAVFPLIADHLTPNGLALVSFNALPGWYGPRAVRDMLTRTCTGTPQQRKAQALALIDTIVAAAPQENDPWRLALASERTILANAPLAYVMHEYFEPVNSQFYFNDVVSMARSQGLEYVADAHPKRMRTGPVPSPVRAAIDAIDDPIEREQRIDYLTNQRFRVSLFRHQTAPAVRHDPAKECILDFALSSQMQVVPGQHVDLSQDHPVAFTGPAGTSVRLPRREAAALMVALSRAGGRPVPARRLITEAARLAGIKDKDKDRVKTALLEIGLTLVFAECLSISAEESPETDRISARPLAFGPARGLAGKQSFVPTARLGSFDLSANARTILAALDGKTSHAQLCGLLPDHNDGQVKAILGDLAAKGFLIA